VIDLEAARPDLVDEYVMQLCYTQHGGSGYGFTRADVLDMSPLEASDCLERLSDNRKREADAIRSQSRGRG